MTPYELNEEGIFKAAREIRSPEDREMYLSKACGDDSGLRARIDALLRVDEDESAFLNSPPTAVFAVNQQPATEQPGTLIGNYKLMEKIGEGGMGIVFVAEQQRPVRRKVAIKIIKPGMDSSDVVGRFHAERQALALMDHPNMGACQGLWGVERGGKCQCMFSVVLW